MVSCPFKDRKPFYTVAVFLENSLQPDILIGYERIVSAHFIHALAFLSMTGELLSWTFLFSFAKFFKTFFLISF